MRTSLKWLLTALAALSFVWLGSSAPVRAEDNLSSLAQRVARLAETTRQVEAIGAVKRLQHAYGHYAEFGLWHDFADLFADKAVGHYSQGDLDREGIRKLFLQDVGRGKRGLDDNRLYPHIVMQPVISVAPDGNSAKGRWHILAMLGAYGGSATWAGGVYENEYIFENGVWKIQDLHYYSQYNGRYDDPGWTPGKEVIPIHFNAARLGKPVLPIADVPAFPGPLTLSSMGNRVAEITARLQRMQDEIDVTNLQHIYGYYIDRKMWDDVADLFASNGTMQIGQRGVYVGKASIRRGLNVFGPQGLKEGELNDHLQLQTIVTIQPDGRNAKARGVDLGMVGNAGPNGGGRWEESIFENEFVKENDIWKMKTVHLYPRLIVDYEKGWAKDAQPAPGSSTEFPPDRPSTENYEIYPKFQIPPFHFNHPVTGRAPQYPETMQIAASSPVTAPKTASTPAPRTAAELSARIAAAERMLEAVRGYHASENLASAYGYYIDEFSWDDMADIFARDGWKELSYVGVYMGRERIRESVKRRYPNGKPANFFTIHQTIQPVIHVSSDGKTANIRVRLFQMGGTAGGNGSWIAGIYENKSKIEDGAWKLSAMDLDYVWTAPYRGGWARVTAPPTQPTPAVQREFPPDRPLRGSITPPFPKILDMPFHYNNPVSGREAPLLLDLR